jgi:hypothetical protein
MPRLSLFSSFAESAEIPKDILLDLTRAAPILDMMNVVGQVLCLFENPKSMK